jgi:hypothetical protein
MRLERRKMVVFGEVIASSFIGHDESPILLAAYSFSEASMSWPTIDTAISILWHFELPN